MNFFFASLFTVHPVHHEHLREASGFMQRSTKKKMYTLSFLNNLLTRAFMSYFDNIIVLTIIYNIKHTFKQYCLQLYYCIINMTKYGMPLHQ